ncbi:ERF family protein [Lactobacillus delbrueckii]|uniref:ERF family protein n=1 Tax=Lactobacillus delbrueckii TaxID=1584 RepID=UPI0025AF5667|nr:ERF family protein [Lactobacillus delbrueckii]
MTEKKVPTISLIRAELKAPKSQFNSFGKYKYRNVEDIYEGVKPLMVKYCAKFDTDIKVSDPQPDGSRLITVTAIFTKDGEEPSEGVGFAETSQHKGMSREQCLGTALSYATKYALNQLFQLDDSRDVDSMDNGNRNSQALSRRQPQPRQTPQQKALHDQATAKMEAMQAAKQEATDKIVDDANGTTLLQLFADAMQAGKGSPKSQELDAWAHQSPENMALVQRIAATGAWK